MFSICSICSKFLDVFEVSNYYSPEKHLLVFGTGMWVVNTQKANIKKPCEHLNKCIVIEISYNLKLSFYLF